MLIDHVVLNVNAGKGGDGVVRWRKEKGIPYGGPAGGDGGKGGDVYLRAVRDVHALSNYKYKKEWAAEDGEAGKKRSMHGGNGNDMYLDIPIGSIIYNHDLDIKYELLTEGEEVLILKGGKGGYGNEKFKSSTNRAPEEFSKGQLGEFCKLEVELEMIADIGIIGMPNAGKSSLLNALTRAGAKVADYAFTTIEPNLGAYYGLVLADIPGLIEGASQGKGLGHKFLKHIMRTPALLHLVSAENSDVVATYKTIRKELSDYNPELLNRDEIVVLSQVDKIFDKADLEKKAKDLEKASGGKVITLSLYDDGSVKALGAVLLSTLQK